MSCTRAGYRHRRRSTSRRCSSSSRQNYRRVLASKQLVAGLTVSTEHAVIALAALSQFVGGWLAVAGAFTRVAAFLMAITRVTAVVLFNLQVGRT